MLDLLTQLHASAVRGADALIDAAIELQSAISALPLPVALAAAAAGLALGSAAARGPRRHTTR